MAETEVSVDDLTIKAEHLCLDFANTADWHASDQPIEYLHRYADLVSWARRAGLLTDHQAERLYREAGHQPEAAGRVLEQAVALREAIYRIFSASAAHRSPGKEDLDLLNTALFEGLRWLRVTQTGATFSWQWDSPAEALDQMLWPLARSAAELLTSEELDRVRECADDQGCGFLFMDMSRNRSRKWCDMKGCGNRAKVRRYRRKHGDE